MDVNALTHQNMKSMRRKASALYFLPLTNTWGNRMPNKCWCPSPRRECLVIPSSPSRASHRAQNGPTAPAVCSLWALWDGHREQTLAPPGPQAPGPQSPAAGGLHSRLGLPSLQTASPCSGYNFSLRPFILESTTLTYSWDSWGFRTWRALQHSPAPPLVWWIRSLRPTGVTAANDNATIRIQAPWFLAQVTFAWA